MNALKNYSDSCLGYRCYYLGKSIILTVSLLLICINVGAAEKIVSAPPAINIADYFKVMLGLAFVIALFLACTFLFKRFGNGHVAGRGQMRVIDGLHLGNRERLVLIEIKDKQLLLSITPGQINKLDTIDINPSLETNDA